jgi:hypothetical protein
MARASALRLRAQVGFSGQKTRLAHEFVVILRPPFLLKTVNLARRYALVALIVVKLCKILNQSCRNSLFFWAPA